MTTTPNVNLITALIADIKLANNGYLVLKSMPYSRQSFAQECVIDGHVEITNGLVHMPRFKVEFFKTAYPVTAFLVLQDGPDYEQEILSGQEAQGIYD